MDEAQKKPARVSAKKKQEFKFEPLKIPNHQLTDSWWVNAWNRNLESYADYASRLPRGREELLGGALLGLCLDNAHNGDIMALVQGTRKKPNQVLVRIQPLAPEKWQQIISLCENQISHLGILLEGRFSPELGEIFLNQKFGLFPSAGEIVMACSCPDWSHICKHVATVLYAIGVKLDTNPALLFELRGVNIHDLLVKSAESKLENLFKQAQHNSTRIIADEYIEKLFNL